MLNLPGSISKLDGQDTIGPFLGNRVVFTIKLAHGHGLGIQRPHFYFVLIGQAVTVEICQSSSQNADAGSFNT